MAGKRWILPSLSNKPEARPVNASGGGSPSTPASSSLALRLDPLLKMLQKEARFLATQLYISGEGKPVTLGPETAELFLGGLVAIIEEVQKISRE